MPLVNVCREYIFMLPLCYRVGKLPPDLIVAQQIKVPISCTKTSN